MIKFAHTASKEADKIGCAGRFAWVFNDYLWAIILLQSDSLKPVTAGLASLRGQFNTDWPVITSGAIIATIPTMVVFVVLQRYFIQGLTLGSGK